MRIDTNKIIGAEAVIIKHSELSKIYELLGLLDEELDDKEHSSSITELSIILKSVLLREIRSETLEIRLAIHEITEYCLKFKGYVFVGNHICNKTEYVERLKSKLLDANSKEISFMSMIENAIIKAIEYRDKCKEFSQEDFVGVCYNALQDYKIFNLDNKLKAKISHYRLNVITGLIIFHIKPSCYEKIQNAVINEESLTPAEIRGIVTSHTNKFVKPYFKKK